MKRSISVVALVFVFVLVFPSIVTSRRIIRTQVKMTRDTRTGTSSSPKTSTSMSHSGNQSFYWRRPTTNPTKPGPDTLQVAGSSLPDCSHACGSCSPCRLVMVSFVCASLEEAETCPMAYRCMCRNKSYPIP